MIMVIGSIERPLLRPPEAATAKVIVYKLFFMKHDFRLRLDWDRPAVLKISTILLKYPPTFFHVFIEKNKYKIRVSVHCNVCIKKLINICKCEKTVIFFFKVEVKIG